MSVLRRLLKFVAPYWKRYALALVFLLAISGLNLLQPMVIGWVVDGVLAAEKYDLLLYAGLAIFGMAAVKGIIQYLQRFNMAYAGQKVVFDIRNTLYRHLQQLSYSFYDQAQTGQLMSRVTSDVNAVQRFLSNGIVQIVSTVVSFSATLILMLSLNWKLTLISMVTVPLLLWRVKIYSTKVRPMFAQIQEQVAVVNTRIQENIAGQRVVKAFARKEYELEKFERDNMELLQRSIRAERLSAINWSLMRLLTETSLALILWYGGRQVISFELSLGTLISFNMLLGQLLGPIRSLGWIVSMVQRTIASGERIFEILDTEADVRDKPGAKPIGKIEGRVTFDNVSFAYDGVNMVLKNINLDVAPGETVAILGGTGSGKSTLIMLIPRFYDPTEGRILIDGIDIRDVTLESLRRQIGIVTQETFLFSASIRDNIAYGKPEATDEEIIEAAKAAHIHDFIMSLPDGYDTIIGERGVGLSGGQKQRVAIARALLMDARILLLDESTSSVDVETEMQIQQAFSRLLKDRTAFIIAQRLSTVRDADRIVVLDNGTIVEEGTHEELLELGGIYTAIYNLQFRPQEINFLGDDEIESVFNQGGGN
ncbi:MAG TPA: ABC transporter ATP-binding protein [Bacillota bacterium]|nr:ABC transporter ATP-binding protein [Candidatus Fermentithermobacillaceae bacterium]HPP60937.1 ABC transporter ATP-binding protein [Bacillota bacterium]HPZ78390.1 ABC transporter ATP-binding protein [Bacillota bacterium]HQD74502.1 ABC transporter ATP-binding protein [Bacillota bacterium]